jgi:hypothetical protein
MNKPKQQIICARVSFDNYLQFEQLCCANGTNMSRAIGEYLSHSISAGKLPLHHLVNDNPIPTNEPGGIGKQ